MIRPHRSVAGVLLVALSTQPLLAGTIVPGELPCIPAGEHAAVTARVDPPLEEGESVRVYFRRLSQEVEDFYWVEMTPDEPGNFWAVLPLPESAPASRHALEGAAGAVRAAWWKAKEASADRDPNGDLDADLIRERAAVGKDVPRDWFADFPTDEGLQDWLDAQSYEPTEWFVARVDGAGAVVERDRMRVTPVDKECRAPLTDDQRDASNELVIGDTAPWQEGDTPFHWECADIETRVAYDGDESGLNCPVAVVWWPAAGIALGALGAIVVYDDEPSPPEVSPSLP